MERSTQIDILTGVSPNETIDRRAIELDTGIGISVAQSALTFNFNGVLFPNIQGQAIEVFDGYASALDASLN